MAGAQIPLSMAREGETVKVVRVSGNDDMRHHLNNLGFVEDAEVVIVSQTGPSGTIVNVKGAQLGIDPDTAKHIYVA